MSADQSSWLRHPLVTMVLGFILTGVLGTAITQHFLDQREQEKLRAQSAIDQKQTVQEFAELNEEWRVYAEILAGMLRNSMPDDKVTAAAQAYEKAYVDWSVERPGMLLIFRGLLSSDNYQFVEAGVKQSLVEKIYNPIRHCLATSLAHVDDKATSTRTLEACRIDELLERASGCSFALAAVVSDLAGTRSGWFSKEDKAEIQQRAYDAIRKQCP